ncbi:hypothetical protein [Halorubrum tebenquichense]|uniref:Uncharacterized protein n=1 Tax=Halorubrum tebenquichense DSM 14210 TaxID=1227485 RepID=M0E481_9EURY|nr:hypothetical protein [Halorubrum tebenquichense]ELZ41863.1 hypothetical protein C472_00429 [Halorubrum tebenquichense DSM 14210]
MNIKQIAKDPLAQLGAGISGIVALLNPEVLLAIFDALLASGPQIFSVVSVSALTLPQVLPPTSPVEWAVVAAAVLFLGYLSQQVYANLDRAT